MIMGAELLELLQERYSDFLEEVVAKKNLKKADQKKGKEPGQFAERLEAIT